MAHVPPPAPRYVPARTNEGWPIVGLVLALTLALVVTATVIHKRTYKDPADPTWHAAGGRDNSTAEGLAH